MAETTASPSLRPRMSYRVHPSFRGVKSPVTEKGRYGTDLHNLRVNTLDESSKFEVNFGTNYTIGQQPPRDGLSGPPGLPRRKHAKFNTPSHQSRAKVQCRRIRIER
jgi:hypothetical protein